MYQGGTKQRMVIGAWLTVFAKKYTIPKTAATTIYL